MLATLTHYFDSKKWPAKWQLSWQLMVSLLVLGSVIVLLGWLSTYFKPLLVVGALIMIMLLLVVWHNPWHGFLLFVFFIPFERIGAYEWGGITIRPSQVTIILVMSGWIIRALRRGTNKSSQKFPSLPIIWPLTLFVIVSLLGLLNAENLVRSLMVLAFIIFTFVIALVVPIMVRTSEQVQQLLKFFLFSMFVVTIFGLWQFVGDLLGLPTVLTGLRDLYTKEVLGFPRVQSTALEPLYFANYLLTPLAILFSFFLARDGSLKNRYIIFLMALGVVNLLFTVARGGYLALAVTLLVLLALHFPRLWSKRNMAYGAGAILGVALLALALFGTGELEEKLGDFTAHVGNIFGGASYSERVETFELAKRAWREHPLLGIGAGGFGPYASTHPMVAPEHGWKIVNNEYLELLAEHGVLGLVLMLGVFVLLVARSLQAFWQVGAEQIEQSEQHYLKAVLAGLLAGFVGILAQYNTFSVLYIVHIWFVVGLLAAVQNLILQKNVDRDN